MACVTTFDVVDCNRALEEAGFVGGVHLHDACGAQALTFDDSLSLGPAPVKPWLRDFFAARGIEVRFVGECNFVVVP